ncbi:TPA: aromatic amino acid aminotransferase [Candidatus Sumerlaeota bacterium]|nr:aromatic amino acid aminotransferase [Candidatus Sumerlaeota bacterium]
MFESLTMAPPDPILGLTDAFNEDTNPKKINLGVGVYQDASGKTPVFTSVKKAEERLWRNEGTKNYLAISGLAEFDKQVQGLVLGSDTALLARAQTAQTPGGTAALRVAADFLKVACKKNKIWISNPSWPNHNNVFQAAGIEVGTYPYYDITEKTLAFDAMMEALRAIPEGDVLLVHGCCHNPSGMDPDVDQWKQIAAVAAERKLLLMVDLAYLGLGRGLEEDAAGVRLLCQSGCDVLIAASFSKNFGLYRERTAGLILIAQDADAAKRAFSHVKQSIRANYSNPPSHGGSVVATILGDPELRQEWENEVADMRGRMQEMRQMFVDTLKAKGVQQDFSFLIRQNGMFSFSGLTKDHVKALREKYGIYTVASGRINVAGMTRNNMDAICQAIAKVL